MAKEIDSILAKINKQFGLDKNVVSMASDNFEKLSIKRVPTASDAINDALYGGLALGKLTEVAGEPGAGKTSLIFETMGLNQKIAKENGEEYYCGLFETEGSYDAQYAKDLGPSIQTGTNQMLLQKRDLRFLYHSLKVVSFV